MARFFREQDIDGKDFNYMFFYIFIKIMYNFIFPEFRECFYLNARNGGMIRTLDELSLIMRSLGESPTMPELKKYLQEKGSFKKIQKFQVFVHN